MPSIASIGVSSEIDTTRASRAICASRPRGTLATIAPTPGSVFFRRPPPLEMSTPTAPPSSGVVATITSCVDDADDGSFEPLRVQARSAASNLRSFTASRGPDVDAGFF